MISRPEKKIFLIWRKDAHQKRYVVGELVQIPDGNFVFRYLLGQDLEEAKVNGFRGYPAFPLIEGLYVFKTNTIESFSRRLPSRAREDFRKLLKYWEINNEHISDFALLSVTGGRLPTDHFEFIDPYESQAPDAFLTQLAGFRFHVQDDALRNLKEGDPVNLIPEPENPDDADAIRVDSGSQKIGYLNRIHAKTVSEAIKKRYRVLSFIKKVEANGIVNSVLLKIIIEKNNDSNLSPRI